MDHPRDRTGVSRRRLLQGAAGGALGIGALGLLAGCENTTTPIGACEGGDGSSNLVVAKPTRAGRPAAARAPTTRSRGRSPRTTSRSPTASPTRAARSGSTTTPTTSTRRWSRSSRSSTGRKVQIATYNSVRRGDREARVRRGRVRRDHRPLRLEHRQPDRAAAAAAAQPLVPAEPREEHLARAAGPVLRPGQPLHRAVRRLVGRDRLAQRQDRRRTSRAMDVPWDIFWESRGLPRQGRPSSTTSATGSRCRCSGTRCAPAAARPQHRGPEIVAKAGKDLGQLTDICNIKVTITDYQTLPEGKTWLHHSWSGDLLGAAFYYLPKGVTAERPLLLGPGRRTASCRTTSSASVARRKNPALAHGFLNFMLDEKNAYDELRQLRRLHAAAEEHRRRRR